MISFRWQNWKKNLVGKVLFLPIIAYVWLVNGTWLERCLFIVCIPIVVFLEVDKKDRGND